MEFINRIQLDQVKKSRLYLSVICDRKLPLLQGYCTHLIFLVVAVAFFAPPQGFRLEGEIPRRRSSNSRVY